MKVLSFVLPMLTLLLLVAADIIKPTPHEVWPVGSYQVVEISGDFHDNDTVAIFFNNDRDALLSGGPAERRYFHVNVPPHAVSPSGGYSELVIVHRHNYYLENVETVWVKVKDH
ncbi:hypothetical protein BGW37DRAFT_478324 [Umbelopsis sp. PMI_123]|nr:hypothetical protein BGW37DRAFT_478324 [Umbelopsis sp. PMI_123]